jgi:hypothetical protein
VALGELIVYSDRLWDGQLRKRSLIPGRVKKFVSSPQGLHRLFSTSSPLSNGYQRELTAEE